MLTIGLAMGSMNQVSLTQAGMLLQRDARTHLLPWHDTCSPEALDYEKHFQMGISAHSSLVLVLDH